jgi:hypothetical protein
MLRWGFEPDTALGRTQGQRDRHAAANLLGKQGWSQFCHQIDRQLTQLAIALALLSLQLQRIQPTWNLTEKFMIFCPAMRLKSTLSRRDRQGFILALP